MSIKSFLHLLVGAACLLFSITSCSSSGVEEGRSTDPQSPNVIIIFADDQGYGDLGCYGSPNICTPHLDQMAMEGMRLTNFYAFPSCSPSRAALLTGCYPPRVGIPDVIGPLGPNWTADKQYGLHQRETTLAEVLQQRGYTTAMVGKWHLGHFPETMPLQHGFASFFGLPYSNDMIPTDFHTYPDLPLLQNHDTLALNPDQSQLTERYVARAVDFIRAHQDQPFFLYLAHSMPHVPLFTSPAFADHSGKGLYADVIEEIDAGVGSIFATLSALELDENTIVIYTSDNGPWLTYGNHAGSAGRFREGKGTTYEGGMRVPMLVRWPGQIPAGQVNHAPASLIDLMPTLIAFTGAELPSAKTDGRNLSNLLLRNETPAESPFFYYRSGNVDAVRLGDWKLHIPHIFRYVDTLGNDGIRGRYAYRETGLELYNLVDDPGEQYNRAVQEPERVAQLQQLIETEQAQMNQEKRPAFYAEKQAD